MTKEIPSDPELQDDFNNEATAAANAKVWCSLINLNSATKHNQIRSRAVNIPPCKHKKSLITGERARTKMTSGADEEDSVRLSCSSIFFNLMTGTLIEDTRG